MNSSSSKLEADQIIKINKSERWIVYRRLQELEIPCRCGTNQPLSYQLNDVTSAIQVWSVVRQLTVPRRELASWLECCWRISK